MLNLHYLKYFHDSVRLGGVGLAAKANYVSSPAISQAIRWLEDWYQIDLIIHGKNKFILTQKGREVYQLSIDLIEASNIFNKSVESLRTSSEKFHFSIQQSIANTALSTVIKNVSIKFPNLATNVRIGTSHRCKELMDQGKIHYSVSIDNVKFGTQFVPIHIGKFVFISAKNDKRKFEQAGFILTEDTKEVIELKSNYFKKHKEKMPVNFNISSWGVIANMAIQGNGIAYIPDYFLKGISRSLYTIRKIDLPTASYNINFYYSDLVEINEKHLFFISELKKQLKSL